jgi:Helix-turn-helix of DDE superfamily endonuclease
LSAQTLSYVARIVRRHRKKIGSAWRKLNPGRQSLLVLAYLRKGETFADLAAGFAVSTAIAWRYVWEDRRPARRSLTEAAPDAGTGQARRTRLPGDRRHLGPHRGVATDRPFYSGKHRRHGMNLQVITPRR